MSDNKNKPKGTPKSNPSVGKESAKGQVSKIHHKRSTETFSEPPKKDLNKSFVFKPGPSKPKK